MKKLSILFTLIASSTTFATLKYDSMTNRFYSENASENVDQDEYHEIICIIKEECPQGIFNLTNLQLAQLFTFLKMIEDPSLNPTILQVIKDIEQFIKEYRKNIMHACML